MLFIITFCFGESIQLNILTSVVEERAKFRHQSQNEEADDSDLDLNKGEDDLDSGPFASVDEKMQKREEEKEEIELPPVIHAKSVRMTVCYFLGRSNKYFLQNFY